MNLYGVIYVQRRRRWWELLRQLDPKLSMSKTLPAEMLLEHSGLSHNERLMIMTSTFNNLEFENVAEALIKQHALNNVAKDDGSAGQRKGKGKGKWRPRAYLASYDGMDDAGEYYDPEIWAYNGQDEILRMRGLQMTAKKIGGTSTQMDTTPGGTPQIWFLTAEELT